MKTFHFLNEMKIFYFHVFTYSERENTKAYRKQGMIPAYIRYKRNKILRRLSEIKRYIFYKSQIGMEKKTVIFENENREGFLYGFTDNFIRVKIPYNEGIPNRFQKVNIKKLDSKGIMLIEKI